MAQERTWDFGATLTADRFSQTYKYLYNPGVYSGFDLTCPEAHTIRLGSSTSPNVLMLPNGTLINETTYVDVRLAYLPSVVTTYTVVAKFEESSVAFATAAVTYVLVLGVHTPSSTEMVLGWVHYSGDGLPLNDVMAISVPKQLPLPRVAAADRILTAPFADAATFHSNNVTVTTVLDKSAPGETESHWPALNITSTVNDAQSHFIWTLTGRRPTYVEIHSKIPVDGGLVVSLYDAANTDVTLLYGGDALVSGVVPLVAAVDGVVALQVPFYTVVDVDGTATPTVNGDFTELGLWRLEVKLSTVVATDAILRSVRIGEAPTLSL